MRKISGFLLALLSAAAVSAQQLDLNVPVDPLRRAYFGDLHLHTSNSFDAAWGGVRTTPRDAYRYAQGYPVTYMGREVQRKAPLDFLAVADHAEYMGVPMQILNRAPEFEGTNWYQSLTEGNRPGFGRIMGSGFRGAEDAAGAELRGAEARQLGRGGPGRERVQPAGQVHQLRRVRVVRHAGRLAPPSRRDLPRPAVPGDAVQRAGLAQARGPVALCRCESRARHRLGADPAQPEPQQRPAVLAARPRRAADDARIRRDQGAQRDAGRDHADQGHQRDASAALAERRVRRLRDPRTLHRRARRAKSTAATCASR